jgi:hypothetical protein
MGVEAVKQNISSLIQKPFSLKSNFIEAFQDRNPLLADRLYPG